MSRRWAVFTIASLNFFLSQFYRASNAVISMDLLRDLSIDTQGLGLLSASFFYGFALTQIPVSLFLDRVGPRRMMTGLSLLGILGALIFSWAGNLNSGLAGRFLLGVGMACNLMGTLKLLSLWFGPLSFATLSGILFSIGTFGNMAAATPLVLLAGRLGWRGSFQVIAGVNLLLVPLFYLIVRDGPEEESSISHGPDVTGKPPKLFSGLLLLLRLKEYWIISLGTLVSYGVLAAFQALWAGPYLMEAMGLSAVNAGNIILLLNVGLIIGGPAWGLLSDRVFRTHKWIIFWGHVMFFLVMTVAALLPPGTGLVVLGLLFFSFGLFRTTGILMYAHIKELMPLEMAGTAMAGINFFTMLGSAIFLQGLGSLMQGFYPQASRGPEAFEMAFLVCGASVLAISLLYLLTRERNR
ncbi:MAG: MFS transporter [Pseudomonadota bacterium]